MNRAIAFALAFLALLGAVAFFSYRAGESALQARFDARQVQIDADHAEARRKLDAAEQAQRAAAQQFEDKLNATPDTGAVCIPDGWVR
jgi:F0F1-type ATP synthase membrane subunit b/b'